MSVFEKGVGWEKRG